jgi:hypothetical protein
MSAADDAHSPAISVLLPCFNTPTSFLAEAIDSIRAQTFTVSGRHARRAPRRTVEKLTKASWQLFHPLSRMSS